VTLVSWAAGLVQDGYALTILRGSLVGLGSLCLVYVLNRTLPGWVAATLFLLFLVLVPALSDDPQQVVDGRTLFVFVIPILIASVLLRPYASFFVAGLVSVVLAIVAIGAQIVPNLIAVFGFFAIALMSWLSARSLERALDGLRTTNLELDKRVDERTRDLAEVLAREHAELSKNQAILEGIADGVIVFDQKGNAIVANAAIGRILARSSEGILGCDIRTLMGEDVAESDQELLSSLLGGQEVRHSDVRLEWGDKTLSVSVAPVRSAPGQMAGTVAVFRDFTREAAVDRMKSDFVSIVSHELRTPLTSVKGYLDLVLMGAAGPTNKQQESFLKIARDNADRLHALVSDLLDISRIESGRMELDVQVVSFPEIVEQVASGLWKEFEDRGLRLRLDVPSDLPEIFGDPDRISQILMNLLSNAYKYTNEGGATLEVEAVKGALLVTVRDTGVGIAREDLEELFTPFFRAEDRAVRQQTGTGLGLSITRSLVEMHGGEIWVQSTPGEGSLFGFTLPLPAGLVEEAPPGRVRTVAPEARLPRAAKASATTWPSGPWILVADDEADVSGLFRRLLERAGFRVAVVNSGARVADVARQLRPELITLDLLMDVDGLVILQELKADPATADIPVVIISVIPEPQKGLALGAADYLVKPIDEEELLDCILAVLGPLEEETRNTILVVDDEADILGWLRHFLTHSGFRVTEAYDGIQALESVASERPDLILLDMKMPRMDGRAVLRRLRQSEDTSEIPVIILSAHEVKDEAERGRLLDMGVRQFLRKPVTAKQLIEEIQKHLAV
jgi:PAS domain S-box-containing protein